MTLPTHSQIPIAAPLAGTASASGEKRQISHLGESVGLTIIADQGLLHIRGQDSRAMLQTVYGVEMTTVGSVARVSDGPLACLRSDEFVLVTPDIHDALTRLQSAASANLFTLTDITHGRSIILIAGARATDVLAKVCGLDFSEKAFPDMHAAQTMLAKVRALIIRVDRDQAPAYHLIVERSLAEYVWEILQDAAQEFGSFMLSNSQFLRE